MFFSLDEGYLAFGAVSESKALSGLPVHVVPSSALEAEYLVVVSEGVAGKAIAGARSALERSSSVSGVLVVLAFFAEEHLAVEFVDARSEVVLDVPLRAAAAGEPTPDVHRVHQRASQTLAWARVARSALFVHAGFEVVLQPPVRVVVRAGSEGFTLAVDASNESWAAEKAGLSFSERVEVAEEAVFGAFLADVLSSVLVVLTVLSFSADLGAVAVDVGETISALPAVGARGGVEGVEVAAEAVSSRGAVEALRCLKIVVFACRAVLRLAPVRVAESVGHVEVAEALIAHKLVPAELFQVPAVGAPVEAFSALAGPFISVVAVAARSWCVRHANSPLLSQRESSLAILSSYDVLFGIEETGV